MQHPCSFLFYSRIRLSRLLIASAGALVVQLSVEGSASAQEAVPASAQPSEPTSGNTRGYFQAGVALFSPSGTLAGELAARGVEPWGGPTITLGFTRAPKALPWFRFGAGARGTFGDRVIGDRGYFLNPVFIYGTLAAFAPLGPTDSGLELALDFGFTVILARNQEPNVSANNLNPQTKHEYGLGLAVGLRASYRLYVPAMGGAFKFTLAHSRHVVGVDVSEKPGKTWALGTTAALAGIEW
jgi:hypothetical protein